MIWCTQPGPDCDTVVASRVTLYRNLVDYPFVHKLSAEAAEEICSKVSDALTNEGSFCTSENSAPLFADERTQKEPGALVISDDSAGIRVSVCEKEHITISCTLAGNAAAQAYERVKNIDEVLDGKLTYAFSEKYGYLNSSAELLGPGMKAEMSLFLPLLCDSGQSEAQAMSLSGYRISSRQHRGAFFDMETYAVIGSDEQDALTRISYCAGCLSSRERAIRSSLQAEDSDRLSDRVSRAYGALKYSMLLTFEEFMQAASDIRLGIALGIIKDMDYQSLGKLIIDALPKSIKPSGDHPKEKLRAELVRSRLSRLTEASV